jgi:uncharacterized Zn finger protein
MPDRWRTWSPSSPLPVDGGLTARSTRGQIGEQWWSKRFIGVMESFALGSRLTRARAYARKGQVISLDVDPGVVTATVQGSRITPYHVRIKFKQFSQLIWAKAEVVLAEQAIHSARLLAGEFPPELEAVFEGIGAPLFPRRLGDLIMTCSCPDDAVPCKHLAATFYLLAERFDDDPFLILRWRGRPRVALLARLRELRGDEPGDMQETPATPGVATGITAAAAGAALALAIPYESAPVTTAIGTGAISFWAAGAPPPLPGQPELPVDLLLRQLPMPGAALGGSRLISYLTPLYEQLR